MMVLVFLEGEIVRWSTDGGIFAVQSGKEIDIYGTVRSPGFLQSFLLLLLISSVGHVPSPQHNSPFAVT